MKKVYQYNDEFKNRSRALRRSQTDAEQLLWSKLRGKQMQGLKLYRQYPLGPYILDFYCPNKRLAIELDGSQHIENAEYDEKRKLYLNKFNIKILRFWDNDVLKKLQTVLEEIYNSIPQG